MPTHVIYHIPGIKVGCTTDLDYRKYTANQDGKGDIYKEAVVIEELNCSDQEAGDREWYWADHYGYKRGPHYSDMMKGHLTQKNNKLGLHDPSIRRMGTEASRVAGEGLWNPENRHVITPEAARLGLEARRSRGTDVFKIVTCPHCGTEGNSTIMARWHFDRCKNAPTASSNEASRLSGSSSQESSDAA